MRHRPGAGLLPVGPGAGAWQIGFDFRGGFFYILRSAFVLGSQDELVRVHSVGGDLVAVTFSSAVLAELQVCPFEAQAEEAVAPRAGRADSTVQGA